MTCRTVSESVMPFSLVTEERHMHKEPGDAQLRTILQALPYSMCIHPEKGPFLTENIK